MAKSSYKTDTETSGSKKSGLLYLLIGLAVIIVIVVLLFAFNVIDINSGGGNIELPDTNVDVDVPDVNVDAPDASADPVAPSN